MSVLTVPQVVHTWRLGSVEGLSWSFVCLQVMTSGFFLAYGILLPSMPVSLANGASLTGSLCLAGALVRFRHVGAEV